MSKPIEPADCLEAVKQQGAVEALEDIKYEFVCMKSHDRRRYDECETLVMKNNVRGCLYTWEEAIQIIEKKLSQYPKCETEGDTTEEGTG